MVFASRSKRCLHIGSEENCGGRILMATVRSSRASRARYTSPIPPAPSGAMISYGPSFVPAASVIGGGDYNLAESSHGIPHRRHHTRLACIIHKSGAPKSFFVRAKQP